MMMTKRLLLVFALITFISNSSAFADEHSYKNSKALEPEKLDQVISQLQKKYSANLTKLEFENKKEPYYKIQIIDKDGFRHNFKYFINNKELLENSSSKSVSFPTKKLFKLEALILKIYKENPGSKVIEAELENGEKPYYKIEIIDKNARLQKLRYNAENGDLLKKR